MNSPPARRKGVCCWAARGSSLTRAASTRLCARACRRLVIQAGLPPRTRMDRTRPRQKRTAHRERVSYADPGGVLPCSRLPARTARVLAGSSCARSSRKDARHSEHEYHRQCSTYLHCSCGTPGRQRAAPRRKTRRARLRIGRQSRARSPKDRCRSSTVAHHLAGTRPRQHSRSCRSS